MKKIGLGLLGLAALIAGLSLILHFWPQTVILFKGIIGSFLAIAGLVMITIARD